MPDGRDLSDLAACFDQAPCGLMATDPSGTVVQMNRTLLDWLGYAHDDVVGTKAFTDLLTVGGRLFHETHYHPTLQLRGEAREIAVELVAADGTRLPVLLNSVLDGPDGLLPGLVRTAVFSASQRRSYEQELVRERERAQESEARTLEVARTLQRTLFPPTHPVIDGLDVGTAFRPAGDGGIIGGDFYDVVELGPDDWLVAIGDVTGKGIDAAGIASLARHSIRTAAVRSRRLEVVMDQVNQVLLRDDTDRFCTLLLARFTRQDDVWRAAVCPGGHPLPLLVRPGREPERVGRPGRILGAYRTSEFHPTPVAIEPGDTLVLYTDGVTEGRSGNDFYGDERLVDLAARPWSSAAALAAGIVDDVLAFQQGFTADDVAIVTVGVRP